LISGGGTNLQALIDACLDPAFPAEIVLVISNRPDAGGIARAERAGIPVEVIPHQAYPDRAAFDAAIDAALRKARVEFVCLAGFMRLLTAGFMAAWRDRIINIHPSLLPAFPGIHVHEKAIAAGVRFSGCTVHFSRHETDTGPIIVQAVVPIRADDTPEILAARVLAEEHRIYPLALRWIAERRVRVEGERAIVAAALAPTGCLINPDPAT
jgi:phosphoribosylglycinamide formyltransferase-1